MRDQCVLSGHLFQRGLTLILILLSALLRAVSCPYLFPRSYICAVGDTVMQYDARFCAVQV